MSGQAVTFDRIRTGFIVRQGRYYLTVHYENSETGESRTEVASRYFYTESAATEAAEVLATQLVDKIKKGTQE